MWTARGTSCEKLLEVPGSGRLESERDELGLAEMMRMGQMPLSPSGRSRTSWRGPDVRFRPPDAQAYGRRDPADIAGKARFRGGAG